MLLRPSVAVQAHLITFDFVIASKQNRSRAKPATKKQNRRSETVSMTMMSQDVLPYGEFLSDEHNAVREEIRKFATQEIAPKAAAVDSDARFPEETFKKLGELGYLGPLVPEEYGGLGGDYRTYAILVEEIARACGSTGLSFAAHCSLGTNPIKLFGSEEQKKKYLPKMASGEWLGCWALTEPGTGSDAAAQETVAIKNGNSWVLNGRKQFITNASVAGTAVIMAMTDKSRGNKGISAFIVEKDTPGYQISKVERKLGTRGSPTCSIALDDCTVPEENLLGELNEGYKQAIMTLECGRIAGSALIIGIAQAAFDAAF